MLYTTYLASRDSQVAKPYGTSLCARQAKDCPRQTGRVLQPYNRTALPLEELHPGDTVRIRLPGDRVWTKAQCQSTVRSRSYLMQCNGRLYRHNRKDIRKTFETLYPKAEAEFDIESWPKHTRRCRRPEVHHTPTLNPQPHNTKLSVTAELSVPSKVSSCGTL